MACAIERTGDQILVGDFVGSVSDSPDRHFAIGWYCAKRLGVMDAKNFLLLQDNRPVAEGAVTRRIYDGRVADSGRFALQLIGKTGAVSLCIFEPNGQEFWSRQFKEYLEFYDLSADGGLLFWSVSGTVHCTDLMANDEVFSFELEQRFQPTAAKLDADGANLLIRHAQKGWYRFTRDGDFLDKEAWFVDFIQDCTGVVLYQVIKDLHEEQGAKDSAEALGYAQWIEEALRRGIADSYQLKLSDVYEYLAALYTAAGDAQKAAEAREAAEAHLDGFRLVDRAIARFKALGSPPNQELAKQILADLERAPRTERLLEYPNYVGKMYRTQGELLELLGHTDGAITAYRKAVEANPKVGCIKQLEKLTGGPVALPEKPKPRPIEERIYCDRLTMFHFRCPVCGGPPKEVPLLEYLAGWQDSDPSRLESVFAHLLASTQEMRNSRLYSHKSFQAAADELVQVLSSCLHNYALSPAPFLTARDAKHLVMQTQCPVCQMPAGTRKKDNYFTLWPEACRVQSSNLFYEIGLILFGFHSVSLAWLPDGLRQSCDTIRPLIFRLGETVGLPSCPQCGRFTSCLYGGSRSDPEKGMCRWCLDASGANQITITLNLGDIARQALSPDSPSS
jgi:tetratricopeptide (TPR) repeat protein